MASSKSKAAVVAIETGSAVKSLADLRKQINDLKAELYTLTEGTATYNAKVQELSYAQDELNGFMAKTRQGCAALEGSYNALSYEMGVLKQEWKATNDEAKREELGKQINAINDKLKELDESVGNHQRNVGNYTKSMQEAFQNVGLTIGNISPLFSNLANAVMESGEKGKGAFAALATGAKGLGAQLKALAANPVGAVIMAIVIAVKAAKAIFDKFKLSVEGNEKAQNNLKKAMAPIQAIVNAVKAAFDGFVETLTEAAAAIGNLISATLDFLGIQQERVEAENQIAEMEISNAQMKRQYLEENAKLDMEASDARAKAAEKEKYTNAERLAFMQEYKDKQEKIAAHNLEQAQKELELLELQAAQGTNNTETENKLAEAKARVYQVQKDYNNILRETNAQMTEIERSMKAEEEAQKKAKEDAAKKWADEIKRLKEEYKSLMATMDEATKGGNLEYEIGKAQEAHRERVAKLAAELKKAAITQKEYTKAVYQSENMLYQEEKALREAEAKAIAEYNDKFAEMTRTAYQNESAAIDAAAAAAYAELNVMSARMDMTDEDLARRQETIRSYYNEQRKAAQAKGLDDQVAMNQAFNERIRKANELSLKEEYAQRKISAIAYFKAQYTMQIEANQQEIDLQTQYLEQLRTIYGEESQIYQDKAAEVQLLIRELAQTNLELTEEQFNTIIDHNVELYAQMSDMMSAFVSEMAGLGDGFSSEWSKVFDSITAGVYAVGEAMKVNAKEAHTTEEAWGSWLSVAGAGLGAVTNLLGALSAEQDTTTRQGFETQKKFSIAQAVMAMLQGIVGAWSGAMQFPFPANVIIGTIMSTMMGAIGGVQIANIKKQQFNSASSSGSSANTGVASVNADSVSSIIAPVQWSSNVETASQQESVADTRVYIVESDITSTARKVQVDESENRF